MLVDGGNTAYLSGHMVQYFVCYNGANTEPFSAVGGEAAAEIVKAPIGNTTDNIKTFFNLTKTRYCRYSIRGEQQGLSFDPRQGLNDVLRLIRQLNLVGPFILGSACRQVQRTICNRDSHSSWPERLL